MPDLYKRALAWQEGDIPTLEGIMNALQHTYHGINDSFSERSEIRSACDELLIHKRLPAFFRSRLHFYKAWTEDSGDSEDDSDLERTREQLDDAMYWCNDVRQTMLEAGLQDVRVELLWDDIIWSLAKLGQYKEDEAEESDEAAEDAEITAPAPTTATAPPPPAPSASGGKLSFTQEQKLEGANAPRAYERRIFEEA
ncbi:hypothetical protein LTR09_003712 [Extremus antarcticus]|uniref:Uncharacterized protein n=1 Tax=Extremus antarcticus TaxID=702011 RepID=A0AAJ0DJ90_9PEZI|nr:hypothetical protein LTR09_003712 [Extremus antarcticus]